MIPPEEAKPIRRTIKVRFVSADGERVTEAEARPDQCLLRVAQDHDQPLEGTCEGQMACSTCHVIVAAEDFARLPPASEEEEDLLDLAARVTRTSRLACQIVLGDALETLTVRMPGEAHDMQGR
jgi:ferredoxin